MGRSKPLLGYKPQAKTAHIKRVYPTDLPPLPPSYEAAVTHRQYQQQQQQQQQYQTAYDEARNRNQYTQHPVHVAHANQSTSSGYNPPTQQPAPANQDAAYYNPAMQHSRYNTPAYQDPACYAPPVQQSTYNAPAAQQRPHANNAPALDAWGAKLAEEEQHYGGSFFEPSHPTVYSNANNARGSDHANGYNNFNNANAYASSSTNVANAYAARNASRANISATSRYFNVPHSAPIPGNNGVNAGRVPPSSGLASMDVDPDPLFDMNIDDPNAMDLDCLFVTYGGVVYLVHSLGMDVNHTPVDDVMAWEAQQSQHQFLQYRQTQNNDLQHQQHQPQRQQFQQSQRQQRQLFQQQQHLQQQQLRPQQQQRLQQQQQRPQQQHQQNQQQLRSRCSGQVRVISQPVPSRLAQPIPSITPTNTTTQPASNVAFTTGHTLSRRNVERVADRFRDLHLSEVGISTSNSLSDGNTTGVGDQRCSHPGSMASAAASGPNSTTPEGTLVSFSSDDLVNLGSPRPSVLGASGVWEDLAGLQNAFIPPSPLVDDSLLVQVPLSSSPYSSSSSSGSSEYSQYFDLRELDWSRSSASSSPMYREQSLSGSDNQRSPARFSRSAQWTPLSKKLQTMSNVTRRCRTKKQKKIIVLGVPRDTLQQTRRKNKLSSSSSARTVRPKKKKAVPKTVTATPPSVVIDSTVVSAEQQPETTRTAHANSLLDVPRRSANPATTPVKAITKVLLPRRVLAASITPPSSRTAIENRRPRKTVTFADDVAPKAVPKAVPAPVTPKAQPLLPSLPITPVREPRVSRSSSNSYEKASYVAPVPSSRDVEKAYSIGWCRYETTSERATPATPPARPRRERENISGSHPLSKVPLERNGKVSVEKASSRTVTEPQPAKCDEKALPGAFPEEPEASGPTLFSWLKQKVLRW
ncbi:hypothetical protein JR316_0005659 [Psilocybe cubensis]|uniref:Uncharacterized protein n=2 Tax=Psilocybe cubensis TaxID=181762 RepID=A0A8H7Y2S2_PSICU|nr:hypothetical protein JR316_0005659 [Psilocybe cubensis]KAH9481139.1 hypothetical protein JR316_0005659 [Psilocybe cubensis]